ncbi:basic proline-rich protein-like [Panicum hallii]|uniref:basic proline-rich protein-like n=1 Tax=Panicum hallii TaxID=206008 RepID=UPI000DF4E16D|nr:basic proline-rich protein-like [Panicum hallii]
MADIGPPPPAPAPPHRPPLTRGEGWARPPSPSPERVAERLRASETQQPLRPLRYCPRHGWGPCPARTPAAPPEPPPPASGSGDPTAGDDIPQRPPTRPSDEAEPSGTSSPPPLLSPSGNRMVRRLAHHLSPRPRQPGSWATTAHPPVVDAGRERSRSPPRRRL